MIKFTLRQPYPGVQELRLEEKDSQIVQNVSKPIQHHR
jgi:hypothetical protein